MGSMALSLSVYGDDFPARFVPLRQRQAQQERLKEGW
jgi:hypothetical protein